LIEQVEEFLIVLVRLLSLHARTPRGGSIPRGA
jgi:hypothetical protein